MSVQMFYMMIGFSLAGYAVIANDSIQTLGTFLSSNRRIPWWVLWLFSGSILGLVLFYGWWSNDGDVSYGRLQKIRQGLETMNLAWYHLLAPLALLVLTRVSIPVSTTFMVLTSFASASVSTKVVLKSVGGYAIAFGSAFVVYGLVMHVAEKMWSERAPLETSQARWVIAQWLTTGFLWSQWLIQDLANIYIYLPRHLPLWTLLLTFAWMQGLQAYLFYKRGGEIQKFVTSKLNTMDIRAATIIDLIYSINLLFFKEYSKLPMSTTWVFVGLLAGRELALSLRLRHQTTTSTLAMLGRDLLKIVLGLLVSVSIVVLIHMLN
ncbi:MAG: hypothetical protein AAGJ35_08895 [Myxococcota bacterium]